ncbi:MAG: ATP-binding cassette domain-containing protein [Thermodesulfobacteriota bacterium]
MLPGTSFSVHKGDNFVVTGENGSGKTSLMKVFTAEIPVCRGSVIRNHKLPLSKNIAYLSFENLKKILKKEASTEEAEYYSGRLIKKDALEHLISNDTPVFKKTNLNSKKITDLSSGELRKFQIIKALENKPEILILDEPFEGLDLSSEKELKFFISSVSSSDTVLFLVTHKPDDTDLEKFKHLHVSNNKVEFYEKYQSGLNFKKQHPDLGKFVYQKKEFKPEIIADIKSADVFYDNRIILKNLDFKISSGEKWVIKGENGCGKSTLLSLITGDHLQSYSNKIEIFGKKTGNW